MTNRFGKFNRRIAIMAVVCMVFTLSMPIGAAAGETSDISNHWAKATIQSWLDDDSISGYPDGSFKPDNNITRAEFMTMVNKSFDYTSMEAITYSDVDADAWYAGDVAKAKKAGYINGYPDGTMKPDKAISREEAASIMMKICKLEASMDAANDFTDSAKMTWSKGAIGACVKNGIMNGYPDRSFGASNMIKRCESVVSLDRADKYESGSVPIIGDTEELTGWIIDRDCLGKNVPTAHGKNCNLMGSMTTPVTGCYASGLGIYTNVSAPAIKTDMANYMVFDGESRTLTRSFLENLPDTWANNITVKVTGYKVTGIPTNLLETNVPEMDSTKVHHTLDGFHVTSIEAAFIDGISTNALPSPNLEIPGSAVLSSIAVTAPANKLVYKVGDLLDITGLAVTGTYSDSTTKVANITAANVTGFDSSVPATNQVLTVKYGYKSVTYMINVVL